MIHTTNSSPSESALIEALREAATQRPSGDLGMTVNELSEQTGIHLRGVRERIRAMLADPQPIIRAGRAHRPDISGRQMSVPVYRIATREERDQ